MLKKYQDAPFPFTLFHFPTITVSCEPTRKWTPCKIPSIFCRSWHFRNKGNVVMHYGVDRSLFLSLWPLDESASLPSAVHWWLITHVHMCVVKVMSGEPIWWWSRLVVWWQASCHRSAQCGCSMLIPWASALCCSQSSDSTAVFLILKLWLRAFLKTFYCLF